MKLRFHEPSWTVLDPSQCRSGRLRGSLARSQNPCVLSKRVGSILLPLLVAGCQTPPRTVDKKEIYIEPTREKAKELARTQRRVVPFPLDAKDQPRCFAIVRAIHG